MRCRKAQHLLNMYIDNELPERSLPTLKGHLAKCKGCNTILTELDKLKKLINTATPYPVNPFLWTRIYNTIRQEAPITVGSIVLRFLKVWSAVSIGLILICGYIISRPEKAIHVERSFIQTAVLDIPMTQENMEKITLNLLVYTNGGIHYAKL